MERIGWGQVVKKGMGKRKVEKLRGERRPIDRQITARETGRVKEWEETLAL